MPIYTDRLILRNFSPLDFDALRELDVNPDVLRYRSRQQITPDMTRAFLERAQQSREETPRLFYAYAVVERERQELLGQCGLTVLVPDASEAFAWYALLPRYWGLGYMSEAVRALLFAALTHFKMHKIIAQCDFNNHASIRVMEKAGMRYEETMRFQGADGSPAGRVLYSVASGDLLLPGGAAIVVEPPL